MECIVAYMEEENLDKEEGEFYFVIFSSWNVKFCYFSCFI